MTDKDIPFKHSATALYDRYMGPLLFEPYAQVVADRLEHNPVPKAAEEAVAALFPGDPPTYMKRGPFSYADPEVIEHDLLAAGLSVVALETVVLTSRVNAHDAAHGIVLGSPFRSEIERRDGCLRSWAASTPSRWSASSSTLPWSRFPRARAANCLRHEV
jgi:hypothetical protein